MSSFETDADIRADEEERRDGLEAENRRLLDALEAVVDAQLGRGGRFPALSAERTDEILLLLLRAGRTVRAHDRVWTIAIPPEDVAAVRAAGGYLTLDEYKAARAASR